MPAAYCRAWQFTFSIYSFCGLMFDSHSRFECGCYLYVLLVVQNVDIYLIFSDTFVPIVSVLF